MRIKTVASVNISFCRLRNEVAIIRFIVSVAEVNYVIIDVIVNKTVVQ